MAAVTPGKLSIVATPIGNLEDVTIRALRILREADLILAEDTRRTRKLCTHHGIATPLRSFHAHSPDTQVARLTSQLVSGKRIALVSDAGTPLVSDPGIRLVAAAHEAGVVVESVPGASAVLAALTVAGVRCDCFRFVGFLPRSGGRRRAVLREIGTERGATVIFESSRRVDKTLRDLGEVVGDARQVVVCRELTKVHEEVVKGRAPELAGRFAQGCRGEVTLVVQGTGEDAGATPCASEASIEARIDEGLAAGRTARDLAREIAASTPLARSEAYRRVLERASTSGKGR